MSEGVPRGLVTFLLTGLPNDPPTDLRTDPPDDSGDESGDGPTGRPAVTASRALDERVRGEIERHGGRVLVVSGPGPATGALAATFTSAGDAAAAAVACQRLLTAEDVPVPAPMALHTGEAGVGDGPHGVSDADRAAGLLALAHPGQVLVSDTTAALLRDRAALRPLGEHRLRGLRSRMAVHQLLAEGLPSAFPDRRDGDGSGGNLPRTVTSFVGREDLVVEVAGLLRAGHLVTLHGVGGVGKTRLALEIGAEVAGEAPDGVWVVELAPLRDPASVPAAIATTLGIPPQGDAPILETVAEVLAGRRLLLVLDNCEHVLDAAAGATRAIRGRCPDVAVLATSREHLGVTGERAVPVAPLEVDHGSASDAVVLFADRARAVRADFGLGDPATAAAVVDICAALDGLPLGIELAAARMAALGATEVRDRLADRFRLLRSTEPGPERQQTLRHAVGWSYDLLDEDERELLRTASVFAGGFDLASICAVARAAGRDHHRDPGEVTDDEVDVLERLDSLVRKSLVVAGHGGPRTRYRLFETIRQFGEDRLVEAGALERLRDGHAAHFAREAAAHWEHWDGPGWRDAVDWVEVELDNLRAGFRWSAARGRPDVATDIAAHAALMGFSTQHFETLSWAEELLEQAAAADVARLPRLCTAAGYACFAGRAEAARANAHRATELEADDRYDPCEPGYAAFVEALASVYCGDLGRYVELTGMVADAYGRDRGYGLAAYVDGLQASGRVEEAVALAEESVAAARELGNPYWVAYALWIAGQAFAKVDAARARAVWDEGVAHVHEHRVRFFEGFLARDAARLHTSDGDPLVAAGLLVDAIVAFHRAGNVPQLIITLASVPALLERLDRLDAAATLLAAMAREPSSAHHVADLADLARRVDRKLGARAARAGAAAGAALDLDGAAAYARHQLELARRVPTARPERPGGLSRREVEVLRLLADGRTAREIAAQLYISARTAEHHVQHVYTKIGVSGRAAATRWALTHGVVGAAADGAPDPVLGEGAVDGTTRRAAR